MIMDFNLNCFENTLVKRKLSLLYKYEQKMETKFF